MKKALAIAGICFTVAVVTVIGFGGSPLQSMMAGADSVRVERGKYLVKIMGCNDCHTPWKMGANGPEPDMTRMLSGHPEQVGPLAAVRAAEGWAWSAAPT